MIKGYSSFQQFAFLWICTSYICKSHRVIFSPNQRCQKTINLFTRVFFPEPSAYALSVFIASDTADTAAKWVPGSNVRRFRTFGWLWINSSAGKEEVLLLFVFKNSGWLWAWPLRERLKLWSRCFWRKAQYVKLTHVVCTLIFQHTWVSPLHYLVGHTRLWVN